MGEQPDGERADDAADEVECDDVERVVVAEAALEQNREVADGAGPPRWPSIPSARRHRRTL